jgi:hypothetical protein
MYGVAGIILAHRDLCARGFSCEGGVAAALRHRSPGGSFLATGGTSCLEILLAGAVGLFTTSATHQPKVMS